VDRIEQELKTALIELCLNNDLRKTLEKNAVDSIYNKYNVETLARKNEEIYSQLALN
jgi:hypothetical protein